LFGQVRECRTNVLVLQIQAVKPVDLVRTSKLRCRQLDEA